MNTSRRIGLLWASTMLFIGALSLTVNGQPKLDDCHSTCLGTATDKMSIALAECENSPPNSKERTRCVRNAEKLFDDTFRRCRSQCRR
jgi:hypothetical protein